MSSFRDSLPDEVLAWYEENEDSLRERFEQELYEDNDSFESKEHQLNSDDCFFEWVWEKYDQEMAKGA